MGSGREPLTPALATCIEDAYAVFDRPKPTSLDVCERCCMYPEIEDHFFEPDIRDLPLHYVKDWFFAASDPLVSLALSRYLLPRVMELLAQGQEIADVGLEVSLKRFGTGLPDRWTAREAEIINRFTQLYLDRFKASDPAPPDNYLDDALCMFASAGQDPDPLLSYVWSWSDADLFGRLAHDWNMAGHFPSIWSTAFWSEDEFSLPGQATRAKQVAKWYRSPEMMARAAAAMDRPDPSGNLHNHAAWILDTLASA
ncbi:hypothetical protein RA27_17080 [Ruegeria sp. ANG-R]|uniref:hypothetical protein n=1 Tax=Ruegeria sp. ANG-R TaxID=1577903 RepID=UPI00057FCC8B|nr:hypothetical protein [Ruegeria sp. ANG-R]KIC40002.1 hypothetical protein RA27_17080 [Ruegeria sp. ANG-R]